MLLFNLFCDDGFAIRHREYPRGFMRMHKAVSYVIIILFPTMRSPWQPLAQASRLHLPNLIIFKQLMTSVPIFLLLHLFPDRDNLV